MVPTIIFIYNADSGRINSTKDWFHKALRPSTYQCNLCGVSFGAFGMKKEWQEYTSSLHLPVEFLHRDEFQDKYPTIKALYPSAYIEIEGKLDVLISQDEMNALTTLEELIQLTETKVQTMKSKILT